MSISECSFFTKLFSPHSSHAGPLGVVSTMSSAALLHPKERQQRLGKSEFLILVPLLFNPTQKRWKADIRSPGLPALPHKAPWPGYLTEYRHLSCKTGFICASVTDQPAVDKDNTHNVCENVYSEWCVIRNVFP